MCSAMIPLLAKEDSLVGRRAPFAKKNLWVTPYEEDKLYPHVSPSSLADDV